MDTDMSITLDGIAKGYIVDRASHLLQACGISNHLINAGGDIRTCGSAAKGRAWRVAVEDPEKSKVAGKVGYALLPSGPAGSRPNFWGWMFGMSSASEEKSAAFKFIAWATGKEISLKLGVKTGQSARKSVWDDQSFLSAFPNKAWADTTMKSLNNAGPESPWPRITQIDEFLDTVGGAINSVILQSEESKIALGKAATKMNEIIQE